MKCLIEEGAQIRLGAWGCHLADRLLCCQFLTVPAVKGSNGLRNSPRCERRPQYDMTLANGLHLHPFYSVTGVLTPQALILRLF